MPLSEFLRLFKVNLDPSQQKPSSTDDPSSRNEDDLVELVWDNSQIIEQGQSTNRVPNSPKGRTVNFFGVESILKDEMVPLLSYPIDDGPSLDFSPEMNNERQNIAMPLLIQSFNDVNSPKGARDGEPTVEIDCSSVGSENCGDHRVPCEQTHNSKRKSRDDIETELVGVMKKPTTGRRGTGSKRSRVAEIHNLSERRRRDRINEKMRALQQLIPNCNKADKASMLDEAIEYMKTLQLQVQIMSMGGGLCIPPMMFRHIHPSFFHVPPFQGAHFPSPLSGQIPGFTPPVYGNSSQGPKSSVPDRSNKNSKLMHNIETSGSLNHISNQVVATNEMLDQSSTVQENNQAILTSNTKTDISK